MDRAVVGRRTVGGRRVNRYRRRQWVYITSADSDTDAKARLRQPGKAAQVTGDRCTAIGTSARRTGKARTLRQREGEQAFGGGQGGIVAHGEVIAHPVAVDGDGSGRGDPHDQVGVFFRDLAGLNDGHGRKRGAAPATGADGRGGTVHKAGELAEFTGLFAAHNLLRQPHKEAHAGLIDVKLGQRGGPQTTVVARQRQRCHGEDG